MIEMSEQEFVAAYCKTQQCAPEKLREILQQHKKRYQPTGWLLLECQDLCSGYLGGRTILPYGPNNTWKEVPDHPISPRGLASDMSVVIGVLKSEAVAAPAGE